MPPSAPRSAPLQSRGLSSGAKAGVSVGTIVGAALVLFCLWPFIARYVRRRRRRDVSPEPFTVDEPPAVSGPPMAEAHDESGERRMSRDSYGVGPDGRPLHRQPSKEHTLESFGGPHDAIPHPPLTSVSGIAQTAASDFPSPFSAPPHLDTNVAHMVASCETRGYSGSYYNPNIPTEAFGSVNWEDKRTPRSGHSISSTKFSAASWFDSLLRRATASRKSTSDPSTQPRPPSRPGEPITSLGFSDSPTDLEAPADILLCRSPRSSRSSGEGNRALDLGGIDFPPASPPAAPPVQPSPGTVNPMEVMGASTMTEQTWRTNAELMRLSRSPPSSSSPPVLSPDVSQSAASPLASDGDPAAGLSSQSPPDSTPEPGLPDTYPATHRANGGEQSNRQALDQMDPILDAFLKDETAFPIPAFDVVPPLDDQTPPYTRHRYTSSADVSHTDNSAYSTPFHAPSPYGTSTLTTPDTRISDATPSPKHMISPDVRHGYSPNPGLSPSPHTPQVLSCDKCSQKFDQPHKLNHHKRYHDRPHVCERPGCGRRFGTKTHLDRHINDKHEQTRRYHCPEQTCLYSRHGGKSFPRKDNLRRHMMNIHGQTPQPDQEFEFVDIAMEGT